MVGSGKYAMNEAKTNVFESAIGLVEKTADILNFNKRSTGWK